MEKIFGKCYICCSIVFLVAVNLIYHHPTEPSTEEINVSITGRDGEEIYAIFDLGHESICTTETLPANFTFHSDTIDLKVALIDYQNADHFTITLNKGNAVCLNASSKGVFGTITSSSTTTRTLADEEIQSFLKTMDQS